MIMFQGGRRRGRGRRVGDCGEQGSIANRDRGPWGCFFLGVDGVSFWYKGSMELFFPYGESFFLLSRFMDPVLEC